MDTRRRARTGSTHDLPGSFVQVPILRRQVVDPRTHEVLREEHRYVLCAGTRQRLLKDLEAPRLALRGRVYGEKRLCAIDKLSSFDARR
jgi:hypothetical protein